MHCAERMTADPVPEASDRDREMIIYHGSTRLAMEKSYHRVSRVLPMLTKRELDIIGDVVDEFVKKDRLEEKSAETSIPVDACDFGIHSLSEDELLAQIDRSLAQANLGEVRDATEFEAEFDAELKAAYGI